MSALRDTRKHAPQRFTVLLSRLRQNPAPRLPLLLLLLTSFPQTLSAQADTGGLRGSVSDQTGAVVVGARITLRRAGSAAVEREAATDAEGGFAFDGLRFGNYTLEVSAQGFRAAEQRGKVGPSARALGLVLEAAPVSESVTVSEADAGVETTLRLPTTLRETPHSVTVIGSERVREQNFRQVPDVLAYANMTANSFRTGGYHFYSRGYRMLPDDTRVDGFAGLNAGGGFGASLFGVEQVVMLRGPASLLYGPAGAPGGLVNLVTKKPQELRFTRLDLRGGGYAGNGVGPGERFSGGFDLDSTGALAKRGRVLYRTLLTVENMNYFTRGVLDRNRYASASLTFKLDEEGRYTFTPVAQYTRLARPAGGGIVVSPSTSLSTSDGASGPINRRVTEGPRRGPRRHPAGRAPRQ